MRKVVELANIAQTIPLNAIYTSYDIQNSMLEIMSSLVTEHIVRGVSKSFYMLKADGTQDSTRRENISIVVSYVDEFCEPTKHLLTIATNVGQTQRSAETVLTRTGLRDTIHPLF